MITQIKIPDDAYSFIDADNNENDVITDVSKVNILVGLNNSGKSRLLRSLLFKEGEPNSPLFIPDNNYFKIINEKIPELKKEIIEWIDTNGLNIKQISTGDSGDSSLEGILNNIEEFEFIEPGKDYIKSVIKLREYFYSLKKNNKRTAYQNFNGKAPRQVSISSIGRELLKIFNEVFKDLDDELNDSNLFYNFTKVYIPIIRGLRPVTIDHKEVYFLRTSKDYFKNRNELELKNNYNIEVFTGLKAYETVKMYLLGTLYQRKLIKKYEEYLSQQFFDDEPIALIPKEEGGDQVLTIKIGNEHEMPIYHLGDGIQSIITITMPLFLRENKNENVLVFIEEPEYLLHPSLQRKLIETFFDSHFDNYQFFLTTHSNHFLDVTLDFEQVSMFKVQKSLFGTDEEEIPKFSIKKIDFGDESVLNLLGVKRSSVFLPNCNVFVEGITDNLYFSHYLKIYQDYTDSKNIMEDRHYTFETYGGSDIANSSLLNDTNSNGIDRFFVIKDRDDEDRDDPLIEKLNSVFGDHFYLLKCREVENLIKKEILLEIIKNDSRCADLDINEDFTYEDYKNERLGKFIDKTILNDKKRVYKKKKNDKLSNKKGFFFKAEKFIKNWDDLSPEAQKLTKMIYEFIESNNSS